MTFYIKQSAEGWTERNTFKQIIVRKPAALFSKIQVLKVVWCFSITFDKKNKNKNK